MNYRTVIYTGTLLTGLTGLVYQVIWQKYLSFVVGSEARSVSLVVAVFLAGLAAGYRYWGKLTERGFTRRGLLRLYGWIEIGIGVWAALFPLYVQIVRWVSYHGPSWFLTDIVAAAMTLLVPTFLMGATIPLLVAVVPEQSHEVHLCHARVYGINTLGACLGAFAASFFLIPRLGLDGSLLLAGGVNLIVGTTFVLNRLHHTVSKKDPIETIPNRFGARTLYVYTLVTGTVTLSLEVLFVRVLNLTIGAGPHNFAIILGVFVFGLALGSLTLTSRLLSVKTLFRALTLLLGYLMLLFYSVPYWPYWLSNLRAMLESLPINYGVYLILVTVFLLIALLPLLIPMGFMLPLVYSLLPKDSTDYGKKCGRLYFFNTLGTALGSIVLSYLLLHLLDLDQVFKIDVAIIAVLAVYLAYREKRRWLVVSVLIAGVLFAVGPRWDRGAHYQGLFRYQGINNFNFQGLLQIPNFTHEVIYFDDGPDVTVTVARYFDDVSARPGVVYGGEDVLNMALFNNGRSEGHNVLDYSTMALSALLPYLHAPERSDLDVGVVGLGCGLTAGILGQAEDVRRVRVIEISNTVIEAAAAFDEANWGVTSNPKVENVATDGFKYLARLKEPLDILVSEPSVPWVVGVENLFTPEYYRLARRALKDDGVFMQWFALYAAFDDSLARTVIGNLQQVFPHMRMYRISSSEVGVLASPSPLHFPEDNRRLEEPAIHEASRMIHFIDIDQLALIAVFDSPQLRFLAAADNLRPHTLGRPSLSYRSDQLRFVNAPTTIDNLIDRRLTRMTGHSDRREAAFDGLMKKFPEGMDCWQPFSGGQLFCDRFNELREAQLKYSSEGQTVPWTARIEAYDLLRQAGVRPKDANFLSRATRELIERRPTEGGILESIVASYTKDALWDDAVRDIALLETRGVIDRNRHGTLMSMIEHGRRGQTEYARRYRKADPAFRP